MEEETNLPLTIDAKERPNYLLPKAEVLKQLAEYYPEELDKPKIQYAEFDVTMLGRALAYHNWTIEEFHKRFEETNRNIPLIVEQEIWENSPHAQIHFKLILIGLTTNIEASAFLAYSEFHPGTNELRVIKKPTDSVPFLFNDHLKPNPKSRGWRS